MKHLASPSERAGRNALYAGVLTWLRSRKRLQIPPRSNIGVRVPTKLGHSFRKRRAVRLNRWAWRPWIALPGALRQSPFWMPIRGSFQRRLIARAIERSNFVFVGRLQLSISQHWLFTKSLNRGSKEPFSAPACVGIGPRQSTYFSATAAQVSDHDSRSADADGDAKLRHGICWRGSAVRLAAKPDGICRGGVGISERQCQRRHSFTDARTYSPSGRLVGSRRRPDAVTDSIDVEIRADH